MRTLYHGIFDGRPVAVSEMCKRNTAMYSLKGQAPSPDEKLADVIGRGAHYRNFKFKFDRKLTTSTTPFMSI
jgi:hypothetical protein